MVAQNTMGTCEIKQVKLDWTTTSNVNECLEGVKLDWTTTSNVNECLEGVKIPLSLHTDASCSKVPSYISTNI